MAALSLSLLLSAAVGAPTKSLIDDKIIATFTNDTKTTYKWFEQNDPVMGGKSHGNFSLTECSCGETYGVFQGAVELIPKLKAPGFCRALTVPFFENVGDYLDGGLVLTVRSPSTFNSTSFKGFKIAVSAVGVPVHHGGHEAAGSFKAPLILGTTAFPEAWQFITIPWTDFSWDWSDFTGECTTKDPDGYQHKCCKDDSNVCPTKPQLSKVDGLSLWAEGVQGEFHLEIRDIAAHHF